MKTNPPLNVSLSLSTSEAAILLQAVEDALNGDPGSFTRSRLESLRDKVNLAIYGEEKP